MNDHYQEYLDAGVCPGDLPKKKGEKMERDEWEQRYLDLVEEGKLRKNEHATQLRLLGVWDGGWGCPHYHNGKAEGIGSCEAREMRSCILETDHTPCLIFGKIIEQMKEEYETADKANALRGS